MKVAKINELFEKFAKFQLKHKTVFLVVLAIFTILSSLGLQKLKLENGEADWFDDYETVKLNQDHFEEIFGSEDRVIAFIEAEDVFDVEVLQMIQRLGERLLNEVPYADSVTSIVDLNVPVGTEEGFDIKNPFEDGIPLDPKEIAEKKAFILSKESLVNNLVSADATETFVILNLEQYSEDLTIAMHKITPAAMNIFNDPEFVSDKYTIRPAGYSYTEYEEEKEMLSQCVSRIVIGFCVMILCLILFIRSFRGVTVPALATVFGLTSMLGLSSWLNITANTIMLILVVLLAMALSVGYSVHFINSFKMFFRKTGKRQESCILAVKDCGWAILFTVITTMAGMLSFFAAGIRPMRWVAGASASCIFGVYLYVMILLPIFYSYGKDKKVEEKSFKPNVNGELKDGATAFDLKIEKMGKHILNKKWLSVIAGIAVAVFCVPFMLKIEANLNYSEMMGEKIPYIARLLKISNSQLGSQYNYNVFLEFENEDAIKNPEVLKKMDILTQRIGALRLTKLSNGKPRVSSVTKIVKEMNKTLNGDDENQYIIPDDQDLVSQIMFLYEISGGEDLYQYVSEDFSSAYLHVEMSGYKAKECVLDQQQINKWVEELFPDRKTGGVLGAVVQMGVMNQKITDGSVKSIATSMLVILILLLIVFTSLKTGLIAMLPNIAPVLLIAGAMGFFKVPLDMMTAIVMPMILGIAVDDTIHFTNHIKYKYELTKNYKVAILDSYREIGKSMIMTTLILCAMFAIFLTSPMAILVKIGSLSILGLFGALICDYTLTPVLILITKPFGKEGK